MGPRPMTRLTRVRWFHRTYQGYPTEAIYDSKPANPVLLREAALQGYPWFTDDEVGIYAQAEMPTKREMQRQAILVHGVPP